MDGDLDDGDAWKNEAFLEELCRLADEVAASHNPNPTPTTTSAPAPLPTYDPATGTPVSYLPASSVSHLPAASHPSLEPHFSPPREFTQRPPRPPPTAAASARDALATGADAGRDFSPPRELSQRPAPEEGSLAIVAASGSAGQHRFVGTGGGVGAKRVREARELERLKRDLNCVSRQMNEFKNKCTVLRKDITKKDLQIKAKEAEIQNLKKANVSSSKDLCSTGMDIDQSFHTPANGALHAGGSSRTSTRRMNGKEKDIHSLRDGLYLNQGHQTDLPEALELRRSTMVDNGIGTSGIVSLEENTHFEPRSITVKEIKDIGVQTDKASDNEHLDCDKVLVERISSNLRAMWGMPPNSLSRRNLISNIIVSCSEEMLSLLQCARLSDNCEPSSEASSSMNEAISQVYDMFMKMTSGRISIRTFLEALLNLCAFDNAAIVCRTLRVLLRVLQQLLHHGAKSSGSVPSGTTFLLNHMRTTTKTVPPC